MHTDYPLPPSPAEAGFLGEFETHVTVACPDGDLPGLERWAAERGVKLLHIRLARGRTKSQPMVTLNGAGSLRQQRVAAEELTDGLSAAGYRPVRVKIEATPWTDGVPASDEDARRLGPERYFEHHLKVALAADAEREALTAVAAGHGAHVSWNARRVAGPSGRQQRFVTQRCHGVGLRTAGDRLDRLVGAVAGAGFDILSVEREFVVYDSNLAVDDGWFDGTDRR
ncbi:hypothetical protein [Kitasatospora sp. NPDC087315]|uniref:hypothetical protein n=1 Tax=Kitasatospora sp. NPDC087315 TaxID=3364069 RepID=UPI00382D27A6